VSDLTATCEYQFHLRSLLLPQMDTHPKNHSTTFIQSARRITCRLNRLEGLARKQH
jgi:hypothetical protein